MLSSFQRLLRILFGKYWHWDCQDASQVQQRKEKGSSGGRPYQADQGSGQRRQVRQAEEGGAPEEEGCGQGKEVRMVEINVKIDWNICIWIEDHFKVCKLKVSQIIYLNFLLTVLYKVKCIGKETTSAVFWRHVFVLAFGWQDCRLPRGSVSVEGISMTSSCQDTKS